MTKKKYQRYSPEFKRHALKRRLKRHQWMKVLLDKTEPGCEIGMEACAGPHHWGRELQ
jgi:transposase